MKVYVVLGSSCVGRADGRGWIAAVYSDTRSASAHVSACEAFRNACLDEHGAVRLSKPDGRCPDVNCTMSDIDLTSWEIQGFDVLDNYPAEVK